MTQGAVNGALTPTSTTVTTTATAIPSSNASGRRSVIVRNNGDNTVYLGDSSVTTANGMPLAAGGSLSLDLGDDLILYGITSTGTSDVRTLEGA